jgi:dienelactone hydrolase
MRQGPFADVLSFSGRALRLVGILVVAGIVVSSGARAAGPRVLPANQLPADTRLGPLKGEQGDFSFVPARSPEEWKQRSEQVRRILRVTLGLWPMPTSTPLHPVLHGKMDREDYTVEKVAFETLPGFYTTGSLYRPRDREGKKPGVLCPHGHFPGGRFQDVGREAVRRQIAQGAERFEDEGRSVMQSRCVQLARMGCVVFHYDMIGYADSVQLPLERVHQFSRERLKSKQAPESGLYSAAAELRLQNVLGLHTYQSIRALDFLTSLPDVDPKRIAVTGASGGGTQTFFLCAVDDRPLVSVPVVIVSTMRQGGCTCENICGLRIGTYNLEFTALHAPKPLLLISADDATRTMPERGFPELRQHYAALGARDNVAHTALLHFPHNYNSVSRTAMYHFLNNHLRLGQEEPILEAPFRRLTSEQLTVWDDKHPRSQGGPDFERQLLHWLDEDARRQLTALKPRDAGALEHYRKIVGGALDVLVRPGPTEVSWQARQTAQRDGYRETLGLLRYRSVEGHQAELPVVQYVPKVPVGRTVVWVDGEGKSGLYQADGSLKAVVRSLLDAGMAVLSADLLYQGEFLADGKLMTRGRWLPGEEAFAGWTYCYNLPPFAQRVHDILALAAFARQQEPRPKEVALLGLNGAGPLAAVALAQARGAFTRAAVDLGGFRFARLTDVYDIHFLPGAVKYGDLPGLLALAAPTELWVADGERPALELVRAAYEAAGANTRLTEAPLDQKDRPRAAAAWLQGCQDR